MASKNMTDQEIKISAEILDAQRCRFSVDRQVIPAGGSLQFLGPEQAKGTPLAEKLFAIDYVSGVMLSGNTVTVAKDGPEEWKGLGKKIGQVIREHLKSEVEAILSSVSEKGGGDGSPQDQIRSKVQNVLDTYINPAVANHGGLVSLLDVKGNTVYIKMGGGCQGCGMASVTLKQGVEKSIRQYVPEVDQILDTTDHAAGQNPFYAPSSK